MPLHLAGRPGIIHLLSNSPGQTRAGGYLKTTPPVLLSTEDPAVEPVAHVRFADGPMRPVFEAKDRQFVIDDDGNPVYGVWYIPRDDCEVPIIAQAGANQPAEDL